MLRLNHITFTKQESEESEINQPENEKTDSERLNEGMNLGESITSQTVTSAAEEPVPNMLNILKKKALRVGQISVHLLSSPFGAEIFQHHEELAAEMFPHKVPMIDHQSTLLCIGNPKNASEASFLLELNQSPENERLFCAKGELSSIEVMVDPLQLCTLNAFVKTINCICAKEVEKSEEKVENPIDELTQSIIKDFVEDNPNNKDEDLKKTIKEIRSGLDLDNLIQSTDSRGNFVPTSSIVFDFQFHLKMMSAIVIHDWNNSNRLYKRSFDGYSRIGSTDP